MPSKRVDWTLVGQRRRESQDSPTPPPTPLAPPSATKPYPIERFTIQPVERVVYSAQQRLQQRLHQSDAGVNGLPLNSLASGSIFTMWADLTEFGFPGSKKDRWFVVLGRLSNEPEPKPYVVLPLATFNRQGKSAPILPEWATQFYKEVKRDTGSHDTSSTGTDLNPNQAVYARKHHCVSGEILTLATAFIVRPDDLWNIPAKYDGHLVPRSIDDVWNSFEHLVRDHQEYSYLLSTNMPQWDRDDALRAMELPDDWGNHIWCSKKDCLYGAILKSASDKSDVLEILQALVEFPNTAVSDRLLWSLPSTENESW